MGDFVQPEQIASWPMMSDIDRATVETLIAQIEAEVLEITDPLLVADHPIWVSGVIRVAVGRAYDNPRSDESQTTGPFSRRLAPAGGLLLASERRRLAKLAGTDGAFSITPSGGVGVHAEVCALYFGADYCSCGADIAGFALYELADGDYY